MFLQSLKLINFKNYTSQEVEFCDHINCLVGLNGSGKTNILDAIYYLCSTRSAFNSVDAQSIKHEEPFFLIKGQFRLKDNSYDITCSLKREERKLFKVDHQEYEKLSQHVGRFPVVMIAPNDDELIRDGNEVRRKFFDSIISQYDSVYLQSLIEFNHQLKQRNALLKQFKLSNSFNDILLSRYDEKLIGLSREIAQKRLGFVHQYEPYYKKSYHYISDQKESVSIAYNTKCLEEDFASVFKSNRERDLVMQRTSVGIHRDEYIFKIDDHVLKKIGSQGQQKSGLISLKLAQFEFMKAHLEETPILLLDDIFDKLDDQRMVKILDLISSGHFHQIFITDAREERTKVLLGERFEPLKLFTTENGKISSLN